MSEPKKVTLHGLLAPVRQAEKIAPAGSPEHDRYVKAALKHVYPMLKALAERERLKEG